jgi:hypothetical protein
MMTPSYSILACPPWYPLLTFVTQLNLYEFQKILSGPNRGSYGHPNFVRSDRRLCLQMRIRKRIRRAIPTGSAEDSSLPPKTLRVPMVMDSGSSAGAAASRNAGTMEHLQLQELASASKISSPSYLHHGHLPHDSLDQMSRHRFQQEPHGHGMMAMSTTTSVANTASHLKPISTARFGNLETSTITTTVTPGGDRQPTTQLHQFMSYQQQPSGSESDFGKPALPCDSEYFSNAVSTASNSLNILPAAWNTTVTGSSLFGDHQSGDERKRAESGASNNAGSSFRFTSTRYSANPAEALRIESLQQHQPQQQQQLHHGQTSQQGQHPQDADSLSFQFPLSSDLEPTPLPP